jgi:hypothetical protein
MKKHKHLTKEQKAYNFKILFGHGLKDESTVQASRNNMFKDEPASALVIANLLVRASNAAIREEI